PRIPAALVAVLLATLVVALTDLDIPKVGQVAALSLTPSLPAVALGDVLALVPTALGIALVGYTDNVLTSRSVASRHAYKIDLQRELYALGATNTAAGLFGGFPVSSSASRTAVPSSLGSHSQLVGLVAALFLVLALTLAPDVLAAMPSAALAAVIVSAALAIIDVDGYRRLWRVSRSELVLAVVAALAVMVFDVLVGVLIAFVLSVVLLVRRLSRPHDTTLALDPTRGGWVDARHYGLPPTFIGLLVYRFDAPLFFGNIERFRLRLTESLRDNPGEERWVVLDLEGVGEVDATALDGLRELISELTRQNQVVASARANPRVLEALTRGGILEAGLRPFPTIHAAVEAFRKEHPDQPVETPPGV
ncbi:MAG TPA: SulP family inorganic anion transporter, partial [Myxococcota bacterium]|nr:SulP family inorganic anion transporter [Myxococcota bacterium]